MKKLILASASPRRKDILSLLKIEFSIVPADIDESEKENENPTEYVLRLSKEKALKVSSEFPEALVIGSDLTVDLDGKSIGKAKDKYDAEKILKSFSGRSHATRCGYAIVKNEKVIVSGVANTFITFKTISSDELENYISGNEWVGLAGSYGVQGTAAKFVESFKGSYFDILGFPIKEIAKELMNQGIKIDPKALLDIEAMDINKCKKLNEFHNKV